MLDMAAQLSAHVVDLTTVHRFTDPEYAELTVRMRAGENSVLLSGRLHALGLETLHDGIEDAQDAIARTARDGDAITVATYYEARNWICASAMSGCAMAWSTMPARCPATMICRSVAGM